MSVAGFLSNLRKQVSFHRLDNNASNCVTTSDDNIHDEEDQELDGFLVVGERMSHLQIAEDPRSVLPPRTDAVYADRGQEPGYLASQRHSDEPATTNRQAAPTSPVSDVPMDLHPSIKTRHQIDSIFEQVSLEPETLDWAKFSYDFTSEELYLRDGELNTDYSPT
ncbi:hypothetical protein ElyMa_005477100 [Elysia marginata]|uniref:UMA domain-containing protein n=1 Tax=Elysia marginata TaxID=1093978 RepID=A0AAV4ES10_9GAST|nr:hypothetical protein ElyMa_005477100 [Elysia marginata]